MADSLLRRLMLSCQKCFFNEEVLAVWLESWWHHFYGEPFQQLLMLFVNATSIFRVNLGR